VDSARHQLGKVTGLARPLLAYLPDLTFVPIVDKSFESHENRCIRWRSEERDTLISLFNR